MNKRAIAIDLWRKTMIDTFLFNRHFISFHSFCTVLFPCCCFEPHIFLPFATETMYHAVVLSLTFKTCVCMQWYRLFCSPRSILPGRSKPMIKIIPTAPPPSRPHEETHVGARPMHVKMKHSRSSEGRNHWLGGSTFALQNQTPNYQIWLRNQSLLSLFALHTQALTSSCNACNSKTIDQLV